ncbi:Holliday junction resolvase RuvX [Buchnera aphidicola]|uniref:Putative pre-16S rRNA nuclease n=1 Tax=Buchnera aphidicola (Stegophylla sp.) TaxID=2315800 RepID=A0A4D6YEP9_9GAMM|nr:Holliday junction resolvase RuvX [Buchnera aphidicola (Stegophylla sp.)]QCI26503.1 Holliday junction resolvase RuvX [Buchnera aphidicola (Stegophylla sp.)]
MFILSFDFGTKNIGVAVGQQITSTATSLNSIKVKNGKPNWHTISSLISSWKPKLIILGYPLNMNGTKQKITNQVKKFSKSLYKRFCIKIYLHDERLTTKEAKSYLFTQGGYKNLKKNKIDSVSAVLILESWIKHTKKYKYINYIQK